MLRPGVLAALALATAAAASTSAAFRLTSPAFRADARIPAVYTCDGGNGSPPLRWTAPPRRARSLALVVQDPDATSGTFVHWTGWNAAPRTRRLAAGRRLPVEGANSAGGIGYTGPCPPSGNHHYVFRLIVLDTRLRLRRGATPAALARAMRGHVLASSTLVGRYSR